MRDARTRRRLAVTALLAVLVAVGVGSVLIAGRDDDRSDIEALLAPVDGYDPAGPYVNPVNRHSNINPPSVILGQKGVPLVRYADIGYRENPVSASQYGLWAYGAYLRDRRPEHRAIAVHVADWLVRTQTERGWLYRFDFAIDGVKLVEPWASAMAQGQGISLLTRVYRLTGDDRYREAALRAVGPLRVEVGAGGLRRCLFGNCTRPFLEEYPTSPPSYVLNGFMFTLFGLFDLASVAPESDAGSLYAAGRRTLAAALPLYDVDGLASYDLTHLTVPGRKPAIASRRYQAVHVRLLRTLDRLSPNPRFRRYADLWAQRVDDAPG